MSAKKLKMEKELKYPKSIRQILRESSLGYSILVLMDYKNGSVGAIELLRRWKRDKKISEQKLEK